MNLVVDANILFASLIKKDMTSDILFDNNINLYAPEFIFSEFEKYKDYIKNKTERTDEEFNELMDLFERKVSLVPLEEIKPYLEEAEKLSLDPKDISYIALALKLNIPIWSNDKGLKKQNKIKIYSTTDLIHFFKG